jgi:uroporphyrinogen III methyltransferase/synthase
MIVRTDHITRVVITRSREGNLDLAKRLRARGFESVPVDTLAFFPPKDWFIIDNCLNRLNSYDWLVFTSATGANFLAQRMKKLSLKVPWRGRPRVAAVGERTAKALSERGVRVDFIPSHYLTRTLAKELPEGSGRRVLLLRADIADRTMSEALEKRGFSVEEFPIYRTEDLNREKNDLKDADLIMFGSPSAVRGFCNRISKETLKNLNGKRAACIGPVTAQAARENGFKRIIMPGVHTFDSLLEELVRLNGGA